MKSYVCGSSKISSSADVQWVIYVNNLWRANLINCEVKLTVLIHIYCIHLLLFEMFEAANQVKYTVSLTVVKLQIICSSFLAEQAVF